MQPAPVQSSITYLLLSRSLSSPFCNTYVSPFIKRIHTSKPDTSSSDNLFADAAREDELKTGEVKRGSKLAQLESQHENWTGDESIKDSVLRMLMDKYKPLRTGTIQSAEDKLRRAPPKIVGTVSTSTPFSCPGTIKTSTILIPSKPSSGLWAKEPLLPCKPNHEPWHTEFQAPTHQTSSIKLAQMPSSIFSSLPSSKTLEGHSMKPLDRQAIKRTRQAGRWTEARELTLDYRMGVKKPATTSRRPNPIDIKGWTSLVEDRIETGRKTGYFRNIKGKGQPLVRTTEDSNPFISREEFLMNRIVQRNGGAPPWVEVQAELDTAVAGFREILKQSYTRRVVRILASHLSTDRLTSLTQDDIKAHKDSEWIEREKGYHDAAIEELNKLVRKYNGMAPYAVRRSYYVREVEVTKLAHECAQGIMEGLKERSVQTRLNGGRGHKENLLDKNLRHEAGAMKFAFFGWLCALWRRIFGGV